MRILVTGANGFIGKNLCANLGLRTDIELMLFDLPQTIEDLEHLVPQVDLIFHLAGVNRPLNNDEFQSGNADLTHDLLCLVEKENRRIPFVLSSSTQAALDNPYGLSKRNAEELVFDFARRNSAPVYVFRFANVFGKWCRPNYNSVVATFCHNAANRIPLRVDDPAKELSLLYIDDILSELNRIIEGKLTPNADSILYVSPTYPITLGKLAETVNGFADSRMSITLEQNRSDALTQKLYATFLSYLPTDEFDVPADMKHDDRGFFAELIKSPHFGQISVSRTKPGVTRGNHWHNTKVEKFIVVEGSAIIKFRKIGTDETIEYPVSGDEIKIVDIPPGYIHNIQNVGKGDLLTIFWAGELFDPDNPDTFFEKT